MISEIFALENLHLFIRVTFGPTLAVTLLDPLTMGVRHAVAFAGEGFWLFLELLPRVNEHHAPAMVGGLVVSQQPDVSEDAGVVE